MVYQIAIPTYGRPDLVQEKTLALLHSYKIPRQQITLFVANKKEYDSYKKIADTLYGSIVIGVPGIVNQRNFISRYYPIGTHIVSFDDDISALWELRGTKLAPLASLTQTIRRGFALCNKFGYHLWGIYPTKNALWMSPEPSTNLKFLIGHMHGFINRKIPLHVAMKEDYEFSLENAVRDGGVIRLNDIAATTKMGAPGGLGMTVSERKEIYTKAIDFLLKKYPGLVRKNPRREGEILLAREIPASDK